MKVNFDFLSKFKIKIVISLKIKNNYLKMPTNDDQKRSRILTSDKRQKTLSVHCKLY